MPVTDAAVTEMAPPAWTRMPAPLEPSTISDALTETPPSPLLSATMPWEAPFTAPSAAMEMPEPSAPEPWAHIAACISVVPDAMAVTVPKVSTRTAPPPVLDAKTPWRMPLSDPVARTETDPAPLPSAITAAPVSEVADATETDTDPAPAAIALIAAPSAVTFAAVTVTPPASPLLD